MLTVYYCHFSPGDGTPGENARMQHRLGRLLLARGLEELTGCCLKPEALEASLTFTPAGKPMLPAFPSVHFNITHCEGFAACAFGDFPLGLDAEQAGSYASVLEKKVLSEPEIRLLKEKQDPALRREWFHRLWTLKEAYVKMTGTGLDTDLKAFSFSFDPADAGCRWPVCSDGSVACWQTVFPGGKILSLCTHKQGENKPIPVLRNCTESIGQD